MKHQTLIKKAIKKFPECEGKIYRVAMMLGTDSANIRNWLKGNRVDPRFCVAIEVLGGGFVKAHELRPDVFPAPGSSLPIHPNADKGGSYYAGDN